MKTQFLLLLVFLLGSGSVSVRAQQTAPVTSPSPSAEQLKVPAVAPDYRAKQNKLPDLARVGVDMNSAQPLSLREALTMALANNKDIEIARHNVKIAEFDLLGAKGVYDPKLNTISFYERIKTPVSSFLTGGENGAVTTTDYTANVRLEGLSKFGGNYHLDFSSIRQTSNNSFTALSPQYPTALTFTYTQPLIRGFRIDNSRRQIEIARKNLSLTDAQFRHNRRLVSEGQLAPIDLVASESQAAGYEQSLFAALEEVSRSENNLKNLIAENREAPIWNVSLVPTDSVDVTAPSIDLSEALKAAMENRPELQQSTVAREINEIDQRYFRDQTKPAVDLTGTYGVVGLAGTSNTLGTNPFTASSQQVRDRVDLLSVLNGLPPLPVVPPQTITPQLIGGYDQSLQNLFGNQFNNFRVGVQVSLPLRNRTAEAALGRSLVEGERINTQRQQLEQAIQVDVRNALQAVRSAEARLHSAAVARKTSEQQYESEQRKLDAGQSTVFLVLERQTEMTTARGNELRAQTDLNKAIAELQRATGNALQANSIVVRVR
jgi:outer membrane protein TolC